MSEPIYKVLLVDDGDIELKLMGHYMSQVTQSDVWPFKLRVFFAKRISEAKSILEAEKIDICFCDYHLDNETGIDLFIYIRDKHPALSFVSVTGLEDDEINHLIKAYGAEYVLNKDGLDAQIVGDCLSNLMT